MSEFIRKNRLFLILLAVFLFVLEVTAFFYRLPRILLPFQQDEYAHFIVVLQGRHLWDMLDKIGPNLQPALDYLLLRFLWVPVLGWKELALRLPSLFWSMATVGSVCLLTFAYLRRERMSQWSAWGVALLLSLWALVHPTEAEYAAIARHYALVAFVSLLWWYQLVPAAASILNWRFFFLSLTFANSHFFALVLVAGAYGYELLARIWRRQSLWARETVYCLVAPVLIYAFTRLLNRSAFHWLVAATPAPNESVGHWAGIVAAIESALSAWSGFFTFYAAWPYGAALAIVCTVCLLWNKSLAASTRTRLIFFLLAVQPALYLICRYRSTYPFGARYHSVFYGLAFVVLLLVSRSVIDLSFRSVKKKQLRPVVISALLLLLAAPLVSRLASAHFASPGEALAIFRNLNYSENFREQALAQSAKLPLLWIHDACWESDNPHYYLALNAAELADPQGYGRSYPHGFLVIDAYGCEHRHAESRARIEHFYSIHPQSLLVLRAKDVKRAVCAEKLPRPGISGLTVELMPESITPRCVWLVRGAKSLHDVERAARHLGFAPRQPFLADP
jgi:hypothetical protein